MTPSARIQSAIEVLDGVIAAAQGNGASADRLLGEWLRTRRFIGSKDRRAIRELVYGAIRFCGEIPASGRAAMLAMAQGDAAVAGLFDGSKYGPAAIEPDEAIAEAGVAPRWLIGLLEASGLGRAEQAALLDRAPLDVRVNRLKVTRGALAAQLPIAAEPIGTGQALRLAAGTPVETWPTFADGLFEVQDAGSQLACAALAACPGEAVIDLCAGAGGKTLALAAAMDNRGTLLACDVDRGRLSKLGPRAHRAGAIVETRLLDGGREAEQLADWAARADAVLIDAPCSGTGTWRRNPEARWRLTPDALARYCTVQQRLLGLGAALVRSGGRMTYVVCSLLDAEGAQAIAAFLLANPGWAPMTLDDSPGEARGAGVRLDPARTGTDGFFFATLQRL
ncbi:RsmB/NOP family class I SAM-dependent RNA methyltransferase [Novosphingobium sp.]|uniref:RsmB/NOP family class I SAM-dependent RNA methyltransferase n=1 Tax=Novosphingobium sp. TaxID=1874826 RepID=UPI0025DB9340|nr:RsmB/NOP family class I SAM-dependent RNA methyltransferase [Novosphingobium sp.]